MNKSPSPPCFDMGIDDFFVDNNINTESDDKLMTCVMLDEEDRRKIKYVLYGKMFCIL